MALRGIEYLESLPLWDGVQGFDLARPAAVLGLLGDPQNSIPAVHVAGTNGKGTVCALLAAMFYSAGKRVVQFSSPHLTDVLERCLVNGRPAGREIFEEAIDRSIGAAGNCGLILSYFELVTVASFVAAEMVAAEVLIVEAGLGGRLDATNTIARPLLSVITTIGYDHMNILGETIELIAAEKAGIIKAGSPVVCGALPPEAQQVIDAAARTCSAGPLYRWGREYRAQPGPAAPVEVVFGESRAPVILGKGVARYQAEYQLHNVCVAAAAAAVCSLPQSAVQAGIERTRWPGRVELLAAKIAVGSGEVPVLFDVAHNCDGFAAVLKHLKSHFSGRGKIIFLISILDRKEWRAMLKLLGNYRDSVEADVEAVFTQSDEPRAVPPEDLQAVYGSGAADRDPDRALQRCLEQAALVHGEKLVVVTGSLFLVGKLRRQIVQEPFCSIS